MSYRRSLLKCINLLSRRDFLQQASLFVGALPAVLSSGGSKITQTQEHTAEATLANGALSLQNDLIGADWEISQTSLQLLGARSPARPAVIAGPQPAFSLRFADGSRISSTAMRLVDGPRTENLIPRANAARLSERLSGRAITASFEDSQSRVRVNWRAILRDGSHYIRQEINVEAKRGNLPISEVVLLDFSASGATVAGSVKGSPVAAPGWFCSFEHPLSESHIENDHVSCALPRQLPLAEGRNASYSSVIGVTQTEQLRRDFLRYIERERAHPYRTFLHYNSWYDLGYFTPYNQRGAVDAINAFGKQLHNRRGVILDSFLFDDGWDNHASLWGFNSGFPHGFAPVEKAARKCGAAPGVWLSPWGGYDGPRLQRLAYGKQHDYEENSAGFVLSGPRYFERFRAVCMEMLSRYGVNQFKFDGTANAESVYPGSQFNSDFDAMLHLIEDLRSASPDLYVNLTTGTYPSPFWLWYADSTWRGGDDHSFAGVGSSRQQWITYRDAATYEHVVKRGPLYPLNSLMLHGLIYAQHANKLNTDPSHDFRAEVRSYFGTGTQLQEMYISHRLLYTHDWDDIADAARWSRRNSDILADTHWIGGDPAGLEVYGWASWSPRGGIVTLRNPDSAPHEFSLDAQQVFELPAGAPQQYTARSPWREDAQKPAAALKAGEPKIFSLQPFEVLTLEATPR